MICWRGSEGGDVVLMVPRWVGEDEGEQSRAEQKDHAAAGRAAYRPGRLVRSIADMMIAWA